MRATYLTSPEMCRVAGCTFRQLDYWARCGYACPDMSAHGSGTHRRWTLSQAVAVRAMREFIGHGHMPATAVNLYETIAELDSFEMTGHLWVTVDGQVTREFPAEDPSVVAINLDVLATECLARYDALVASSTRRERVVA